MSWQAAAMGLQHGHINGFLAWAREHPEVELVAVAEADAAVRERYAKEYDVPGFASARELFDRHTVDVVGSAPIHADAGAIVCEALGAGAHVILDKPVYSLEDLKAVRTAQADSGKEFWLMLTARYGANIRAMKALADAGRLGKCVNFIGLGPHKLTPASRPGWMFDSSKYLGVLADLAVHSLDLFRWVSGEEVTELVAYESNLRFTERPDFTDNAEVLCKTDSGATGFVRVDWLTPDASPLHGDYRYLLVGTEGYVEVKVHGDVAGNEQAPVTLCTNADGGEVVEAPEIGRGLYEDFLAACGGEADTALTTEDSLRSSELALRAREAAHAGTKLLL